MAFLTWLAWTLLRLVVVLLVAYLLLPLGWKLVAPKFNAAHVPGPLDAKAEPRAPQALKPSLRVDESGGYEVVFGEGRKFARGVVEVHHAGTWYSSHPKAGQIALELASPPSEEAGSDELGAFTRHRTVWKVPGGPVVVATADAFADVPAVRFGLQFPGGAEGVATGRFDRLAFHYPCFRLSGPNQRVLVWRYAIFSPPARRLTAKGTQGPVVFFDNHLDAVVLGPTDHFMVAMTQRGDSPVAPGEFGEVRHGIAGEVREFPAGFSHECVLYLGHGINRSVWEFCDLLRARHRVPRRDPRKDPVLANLGFWTQNGAYYYYNAERGTTYEETILHCRRTFEERGIPFHFFQLDSWWYRKAMKKFWKYPPFKWLGKLVGGGAFGGTLTWEPIPEQFPRGLAWLHERTGWKFVAHSRWFDPNSPYVERYESLGGKHAALPHEPKFWDALMGEAAGWGLACYEQDWMKNAFTRIPGLRQSVDAAENWLTWMAEAAEKHDITVQYCMAPSGALLLAGLKLPAVTHARVTGDYHARVTKQFFFPQFTQTNILAGAVGLWPSLDCYLTRTTPLWKGLYREKYPEQVTLFSALGGGVVCPGDKAERVDWELLRRACTDDGVLIKPDRPVTASDLTFVPNAKPYLADTETRRGGLVWHYVVCVNLWPRRAKDHAVTPRELGWGGFEGVTYDFFGGDLRVVGGDTPLPLPSKRMGLKYHVLAPFISPDVEVALVGSPDKYVACSTDLFEDVQLVPGGRGLRFVARYTPGRALRVLIYCGEGPRRLLVDGRPLAKEDWTFDGSTGTLLATLRFGDSGRAEVLLEL
ncbi:MAG: hypothetical protein Kow0069_35710 [Promethearchaeota archaeon]